MFKVIASCRVAVTRHQHNYSNYAYVEARPVSAAPDVMLADRCWHDDHWRFSNDTTYSVYFTLPSRADVAVLTLDDNGSFRFTECDFTEAENGGGI